MAGRRRRKRQKIILPPELQKLHITIREDGTIDLGVCREAIVDFLRKRADSEPPGIDAPPMPQSE